MSWPEMSRGDEMKEDVVKIEWDQIALQDKINQFFKGRETDQNEQPEKVDLTDKIARRESLNEQMTQIIEKMNMGFAGLENEYNDLRQAYDQLDAEITTIEDKQKQQEYLASVPSEAELMRQEIVGRIGRINDLINRIEDSTLKWESLTALEETIEDRYQQYALAEKDAGKALIAALKMTQMLDVALLAEGLEKRDDLPEVSEPEVSDLPKVAAGNDSPVFARLLSRLEGVRLGKKYLQDEKDARRASLDN